MDMHSPGRTHRDIERQQVALQAAQWLVTLEDSTDEQHEAMADWLLESPLHTYMFLRAAAIDRQGALLDPTVIAVLERQTAGNEAPNVLPLRTDFPQPAAERRWRLPVIGAALAASLACAVGWYHAAGPGSWQRYLTDTGEQRTVVLADGSTVHMNTASRIEVRLSRNARDIRLHRGEALFAVRKDPQRPFRVLVDAATMQAIGTQFNVYRHGKTTTVTVIEGAVQIADDPAQRLQAGEAATVDRNGRIEGGVTAEDVRQVTAWRQHQLVFERASLEEIAAEFNRYHRTPQLRIDPRLAGKHRYTAVFDADDPGLLLQFLARDPALHLDQRGDELMVAPR